MLALSAALALTLLAVVAALRGAGPDDVGVPGQASGRGAAGAADRADPAAEAAQAADGPAHRFQLTTAAGAQVSVPSRPTVLFFMTSEGCGECLEEAAVLDRLAKRWGDQVTVVGVEMVPGTPRKHLDTFSEFLGGLTFPLAVDDGALLRRFAVQSLDTTVVLDAGGREVFRDAAPSTEGTLRQAVARAGVPA